MANFERKGHRQSLAANFHHASLSPTLPPIGVFWDIENCQVPKGKSALAVVQFIRKTFFCGHREAEFMCVCDISKENKEVIQELNNAQVTVVHINATCKNAADDKLRQSMRRFADIHGHPATIMLISGDVNFAADLSDFNHRRHLNIIVLHNNCAPEPLLACAHRHFIFACLLAEIPLRTPVKISSQSTELLINNLPSDQNPSEIRRRLKQLSDNCGGRVISVAQKMAIIKFSTIEAATRARKRMDKEDVFGNKISVNFPKSETGEDKSQNRPAKRTLRGEESNSGFLPNKLQDGIGDICTSPAHRFRKTIFPPPPNLTMQSTNLNQQPEAIPSDNIMREDSPSPQHSAWYPLGVSCGEPLEHSYSKGSSVASSSSSLGSRANTPSQSSTKGSLLKTWCWQKDNAIQCEGGKAGSVHHKSPKHRRNSWTPYRQSMQDRVPHRRTYSQSRQSTPSPSHLCAQMHSWSKSETRSPQLQGSLARLISSCGSNVTHHAATSTTPAYIEGTFNFSKKSGPSCIRELILQSIGAEDLSLPKVNSICHQPVELLITNLDQTIDTKELKDMLIAAFRQHVMVLHVSIVISSENSVMAVVKVPSMQEAQYAISKLHRCKLGFKRINISLSNTNNNNHPLFLVLKSEVTALLRDVPGLKLPLFKFLELFEKRYHHSIGLSELYRMKDAVVIQEEDSGRMVSLNLNYRNTPSPASSEGSKEIQAIMETSFCELHCPNPNLGKGWAEKESSKALPFVQFSLKLLALHVHKLLETHSGTLPLGSFPICYEHEFGPLDIKDDGISLEHLIAAIPGVQIVQNSVGGKRIQWTENLGFPSDIRSTSPPLAAQLALFSREVIDLLKNNPRCVISFNKFIPAYHHHFGRQCRVADYGYTKLIELLEAIPHIIQVMGEGNKRLLTLTHKVQVKRFSADLMRVLKSQASKQVTLDELPVIYSKCLGKEFDVTNYGVCEVADMLAELAENTIIVSNEGPQTVIAIPKREQTAEEIERTKNFAEEVVELLRHSPQCRMSFNKFIPAYHHHFGRQCRVSDYGFTKLIELLEAIPTVIEILETEEEKVLVLREQELLKVFAHQVSMLVRACPGSVLPLHTFISSFTQFHGHSINLTDYKVADVATLLKKIDHTVRVIDTLEGPCITLVNKGFVKQLSGNVCSILMEQPEGSLVLSEFLQIYLQRFGEECGLSNLQKELTNVVKIDETKGFIRLVPLQMFARDVRMLLHDRNGRLLLHQFENVYRERFGFTCCPSRYGYANLSSLFQAIPDVVQLKGKGQKRAVLLNREKSGMPLNGATSCDLKNGDQSSSATLSVKLRPSSADSAVPDEDELFHTYSPVDLLSVPVPSCIPSPCLQPCLLMPSEKDLMRFDSPVITSVDIMIGVPESKSLPAPSTQDSLMVTSALQLLALSPPQHVPGVTVGASVQGKPGIDLTNVKDITPIAIAPCTPPHLMPQMTSTPNGTPVRANVPLTIEESIGDTKIRSCEDLSSLNDVSTVSVEVSIAVSSQSTPTHQTVKNRARPRSRIAAQFSNPPFVQDG